MSRSGKLGHLEKMTLNSEQGLYAGEFRHGLDVKQRLTIPAKWRFSGDEAEVYLAFPDPSGCVTVYPPKMVAELKQKLSSISIGDRRAQKAITRLLGAADTFTIDKSGRININARLYQHAGIDKNVVLVGTVNKFHLWNPERYDAYIAADNDEGDLADILSGLGL